MGVFQENWETVKELGKNVLKQESNESRTKKNLLKADKSCGHTQKPNRCLNA